MIEKFEKELDVVKFVKMQRMIRLALKNHMLDMKQKYDRDPSTTLPGIESLSKNDCDK